MMKRTFVVIFILILTLTSSHLWAETTWTTNAVAIDRNSQFQSYIDNAIIDIFKSSLKKTLCFIYGSAESAFYSLGISADAAILIFEDCPTNGSIVTKRLPKKYYLSFAKEPQLDSWTDFGNRTYFFLQPNFSQEHLRSLLLHEIAMATDAKTGMYYTTYLYYLQSAKNPNSKETIVIMLGNLSPKEKELLNAFNISGWDNLARTFATIRAFAIESESEGRKWYFDQHYECARAVRNVYYQIKSLPEEPRSGDIDFIVEELANIRNVYKPKNREEELNNLNFILSKDLQLKDINGEKVSFCQFMTTPLLTGNATYSILASGPRPRLTGGSGGQGGSNLFEDQAPLRNGILQSEDLRFTSALQELKNQYSNQKK